MTEHKPQYILVFSCADQPNIVHDVSGFIVEQAGDIKESAQFSDAETGTFCMRLQFAMQGESDLSAPRQRFATIAERYGMTWQLHGLEDKPRALIMVSKFDHCLLDLLYRCRLGEIAIDVVAIVSNHANAKEHADRYRLPFYHLPITPDSKARQEAELVKIINDKAVDLVVLARYMQILSGQLCDHLKGRAINIHHSFLPGFKGARPYHQAHKRGVKLIGATAHYVTRDLDEGPIIEQDVARVTHAQSAEELAAAGREIEQRVLCKAVRLQAQRRVVLNGDKTVIFAQ